MFLDDEIFQLVSDRYDSIRTNEDRIKLSKEVLELCLTNIEENLEKAKDKKMAVDVDAVVSIYKKTCRAWDFASERLIKENRAFLKVGGLREYLLSKAFWILNI